MDSDQGRPAGIPADLVLGSPAGAGRGAEAHRPDVAAPALRQRGAGIVVVVAECSGSVHSQASLVRQRDLIKGGWPQFAAVDFDHQPVLSGERRCRSSDSERIRAAKYLHSGACSQISRANTGKPSALEGIRAQVS